MYVSREEFLSFTQNGLKFSCVGCHACCRHDPGLVYLSSSDIDRLTSFLNLSLREFLDKFCRPVAWRGKWIVSLQEKPNFDCIFWDQGCTVYHARPVQCSTYPFWDSIMSRIENWQAEASACPGINQGEVRSHEEIQYQVNLQRDNKPLVMDSLDDWYALGV